MSHPAFERFTYPALESIDFQGLDPACVALIQIFDDITDEVKGKNKDEIEKTLTAYGKLIQKKLRDRFQLNELLFVISDTDATNGFAFTPALTKNNVMINSVSQKMGSATAGKSLLKDKDFDIGQINIAKGTVSGFYSKCPCIVGLTKGMVLSDQFPSEEKVAVLMHEVGHIMAFLETLAYTFSTCFILSNVVSRLTNAKETEKVKIIKDLEANTGLNVSNKDLLLESDDRDAITVSIFSDIHEESKSEFGSTIYDMRSWESLADQFSSRMGMTVPMARAVSKFEKMGNWSTQNMTKFTYWISTIVRWVVTAALTVVNPGFSVLLFIELIYLLIDPTKRTYDKPGERLERLRQEVVQQMKKSIILDDHRVALNQDLEIITGLIKDTNDKEDFHEKVWLFFSSDKREQKAKRLLLQDLQTIANNDLFASANLLKTLK